VDIKISTECGGTVDDLIDIFIGNKIETIGVDGQSRFGISFDYALQRHFSAPNRFEVNRGKILMPEKSRIALSRSGRALEYAASSLMTRRRCSGVISTA
jgi:hypothetical protein